MVFFMATIFGDVQYTPKWDIYQPLLNPPRPRRPPSHQGHWDVGFGLEVVPRSGNFADGKNGMDQLLKHIPIIKKE